MSFELLAVIALVILAVGDLTVGVINDAVNFINSAVGAKAGSRKVILAVASIGILIGATFSDGIIEIARKGIFNPSFFTIPEVIAIFTAVIITDIILIDSYSTFGLPTSTTVSLVFALFGAGLIMAVLKTKSFEQGWLAINSASAFRIMSGIILSVGIAFFAGLFAQFITRLLFTFNYQNHLQKWGFIWCSAFLTATVFFIFFEGGKHASFMTKELQAFIAGNLWQILAFTLIFFSLICFILIKKGANILKLVILIGTAALAMAFAGNDLANFIGVSVGGVNAYLGNNLSQKIATPIWVLFGSGMIMILAMWSSKKAVTVTNTEINLASQEKDAIYHWNSNKFAEKLMMMFLYIFRGLMNIVPANTKKWLQHRFERNAPSQERNAYDLLRAAVNLMVASSVISIATAKSLPISTTYVTFITAMGSSLGDGVWSKTCAPSRIAGVLVVISGWFITAIMAFIIAGIAVSILYYLQTIGLLFLLTILGIITYKLFHLHEKRRKHKESIILAQKNL